MKSIFLLAFSLSTFYFATAQNTVEEKAIQKQIDAFFTSWNNHDFSDMKN